MSYCKFKILGLSPTGNLEVASELIGPGQLTGQNIKPYNQEPCHIDHISSICKHYLRQMIN